MSIFRSRRQFEHEAGPLAGRALDEDVAAVVADDPVGDREAEACSSADLLGCEERIEDALLQSLRDPRTRILEGDSDQLPFALQ